MRPATAGSDGRGSFDDEYKRCSAAERAWRVAPPRRGSRRSHWSGRGRWAAHAISSPPALHDRRRPLSVITASRRVAWHTGAPASPGRRLPAKGPASEFARRQRPAACTAPAAPGGLASCPRAAVTLAPRTAAGYARRAGASDCVSRNRAAAAADCACSGTRARPRARSSRRAPWQQGLLRSAGVPRTPRIPGNPLSPHVAPFPALSPHNLDPAPKIPALGPPGTCLPASQCQ